MPYHPRFNSSHPWLRLLFALLVFLAPMLLGSWGGYHHYQSNLRQESAEAAAHTVNLLETMLSNADAANRQVLPLLDAPCDPALATLREQVALVPFVRSVNLARRDDIYCSSRFGPYRTSYPMKEFARGVLLLNDVGPVRQGHPYLAVRARQGPHSVLSVIDGDYLRFMLSVNDPAMIIMLRVGPHWLDRQGHFFQQAPGLPDEVQVTLGSEVYPFTIYAGHRLSSSWQGMVQRHWFGLWLLVGLSVTFALLIWWLLGRPRSPVSELARALQAREFVPFLQPLVATEDERIIGAEVLMRWQHPDAGLIRPDLFIPQAEASGLIVPMTNLIMAEVGLRLAAEQARLPDGFHISFNISAAHCRDNTLLDECRDFLAHFAPGKVVLVLELTERDLLVADPHTLELFRQLDEMGVKLAMDDFGTGHSSLVYLQQFHVDYLKIDQSFIGRIGTESLSEHIVDNVIDLGSRLGLSLVAEGVETRQQAEYLKGKVAYLQGYLFGRPAPLGDFIAGL
ncbi:EAL domain-containing protein [Aeromonas tecta]|uniref:EAL domain-containing protein n=1 Tax=Aeromonas tecta TaxID=324617 RepID=UPI0006813997|nr:cyclic diguanylate phosphodiesterase [Aeromonas tecta]